MKAIFIRLLWNSKTRAFILWLMRLLPLQRNRVMCVSWGGASYSCNPRAIAERLDKKDWHVCYGLYNANNIVVGSNIEAVEIGSLRYFYLLYTSRFIISNIHLAGCYWPHKTNGQVYIFTTHGGHGIKRIEFDAQLSSQYLNSALLDINRFDLMLSNSRWRTNIYRTAYCYAGEVLEKGLPRNDIFFQKKSIDSSTKKYLLYTPTFRANKQTDVYAFQTAKMIDEVINALEKKFGGEWHIRISSHPNMRGYYKHVYCFSHPRMIDVGESNDLQQLMLDSNALITDYSSAEMDFSLLKRPVFQYCADRKEYDRGFYIVPETLPFPYAETEQQLIDNIINFDNEKYLADLEHFNSDIIGLNETGHATEAVVEWIRSKR